MAEETFLERVRQTSINPATFLSTDYFNHFNGVIMILSMLPDQPDLLPEVESWTFKTYFEHFDDSGLGMAALAKEAYVYSAPDVRSSFEQIIGEMKDMIEGLQQQLPPLQSRDERRFAEIAISASDLLQAYVMKGSDIVNRADAALAQSAIDALF